MQPAKPRDSSKLLELQALIASNGLDAQIEREKREIEQTRAIMRVLDSWQRAQRPKIRKAAA